MANVVVAFIRTMLFRATMLDTFLVAVFDRHAWLDCGGVVDGAVFESRVDRGEHVVSTGGDWIIKFVHTCLGAAAVFPKATMLDALLDTVGAAVVHKALVVLAILLAVWTAVLGAFLGARVDTGPLFELVAIRLAVGPTELVTCLNACLVAGCLGWGVALDGEREVDVKCLALCLAVVALIEHRTILAECQIRIEL